MYVCMRGCLYVCLYVCVYVNNRDDLVSGFDLRLATISHAVILIILTIVIYVVASDNLGFPFLGSITVAVSTALFCRWTMNTLEGELV